MVQPAGTTPRTGSHGRPSGFRPGIQGLRAVSVCLVVAGHVVGWPAGGFIGVDVFFVISGFLITGLLVREWEQNGRISASAFYGRRLRRIAPAAVVTAVGVVGAAAVLTPGTAFRSTAIDALAGVFSVANWRFAATGTDYFAQTGTTSPLQHFWSLAVEEQFYVVWPWLLLLLLLLARRIGDGRRRLVVTVLGAVLAVSLIWCVLQTTSAPTIAYFSSLTRFWELAAGGLLALLSNRLRGLPARVGRLLCAAGLGTIGLAALLVQEGPFFPGPAAMIPVAGAALVIAGGEVERAPVPWVLGNRLSQVLGRLSYSWYLWHFPAYILISRVTVPGSRRTAAALLLGLLLAIACHHLVERPLMRWPALSAAGWRSGAGRLHRAWVASIGRPSLVRLAGAAGVLVLAGASVLIVQPSVAAAQQGRIALPAGLAPQDPPGTPAHGLEQDLIDALSTTEWPTLVPSPAEALEKGSPLKYDPTCSRTDIDDPSACSFGRRSGPEVVVLGDSLGITLLPTVDEAYGAERRVRGLTAAGCVFADVRVAGTTAADPCRSFRARALRYIQETRPATVFLIENSAWTGRLASGASGAAAVAEWRAGIQRTVDAIRSSGASVAVVAPSPDTGTGIAECATPGSRPSACVTTPPPAWRVARAAESSVRGALYVDTAHWYCVDDLCPSFSGRTPIKRDFVHPTAQYAGRVVPDFIAMTRGLMDAG